MTSCNESVTCSKARGLTLTPCKGAFWALQNQNDLETIDHFVFNWHFFHPWPDVFFSPLLQEAWMKLYITSLPWRGSRRSRLCLLWAERLWDDVSTSWCPSAWLAFSIILPQRQVSSVVFQRDHLCSNCRGTCISLAHAHIQWCEKSVCNLPDLSQLKCFRSSNKFKYESKTTPVNSKFSF